MSELSTSRRSYHSPARQQAAAATRERIIDAGTRLVREFTTWDLDELTFRAVAEHAQVSERTVYRHFPTERHLHDAIMSRLEDEAGIAYEDVALDNLAEVTARLFASLGRFAIKDSIGAPHWTAFVGAEAKRHDALKRAVDASAPQLTGCSKTGTGRAARCAVEPTHLRTIGRCVEPGEE